MKPSSIFIFVVTFAFLFLLTNAASRKGGVVGCYYGTWAYNRTGNGRFTPENIDPHLCTHIYYSFMGIDENGEVTSLNRPFDRPFNLDDGNIAKCVALKKINKDLKVLAAIGGWDEGSARFSKMASSPESRAKFIQTVVAGIVGNHFDGVDIDWEYPAQRDGSSLDDFNNYVAFLKELSAAFKPRNLLVTIAVAAGVSSIRQSYDIPNIVPYVDLINVMTYDYSGPWLKTAGFNAPLQGPGIYNVKTSIEYWLENGAPANKLVLGIPLYGRTFSLVNPADNKPGAEISGVGKAGPYTKAAGILSYSEICQNLKDGWKKQWNSTYLVPYAYNGDQWATFDDEKSINLKIKYMKSKKLAGAMIWSLENDDFLGLCGKKFPLLTTIHKGVNGKRSFLELLKNVIHF